MRTLCDVCEAAPARYFCAADEAALCSNCDEKVHGCNKLASRHVRLELAEAREVPRCDICENNSAYFFCGIDGTSLCLQCDMDVHVGGKRTHERYLLMGQRVELPSDSCKGEATLLPNHSESAQDKHRRRQGHDVHHHSLHHQHQNHIGDPKYSGDWNNSNAPGVVIAVGDAELTNGRPMDLNSGPTNLQGQQIHSVQGVQDNEQVSSSDDECVGVVPELSSKDTDTSDS